MAELAVNDGSPDWGRARMRGWSRSTRLVEGDHKMVAPDRLVTGIAGGDPKMAAASADEEWLDADEFQRPSSISSLEE